MMTAQKMGWVLVFCPHLLQASLAFTIDRSAYDCLLEYSETFKGLSRVKRLAIVLILVWVYGTVYDHGWEGRRPMADSNLETTAVSHFLRVINSLEVNGGHAVITSRKDSNSVVYADWPSSLTRSQSSLKHLRFITVHPFTSKRSKLDLSDFKALKIISPDGLFLERLKEGKLGSSLLSVETLHVPYQLFVESSPRDSDVQGDITLSTLLSTKLVPNLREIVVTDRPMDSDASEITSPRSLKMWKERREGLKKE